MEKNIKGKLSKTTNERKNTKAGMKNTCKKIATCENQRDTTKNLSKTAENTRRILR